jgi:dUTP pyrophosphatase
MDAVVKVKRLRDDAHIPKYIRPGDAAFDLYSTEDWVLQPNEQHVFFIGVAMAIPDGHVGLIWDRSSMGVKYGIKVLGGVIDHTYRGDIGVCLVNVTKIPHEVKKGDRIAQMLIQQVFTAEILEVENLDETARGEGRFGSSGR